MPYSEPSKTEKDAYATCIDVVKGAREILYLIDGAILAAGGGGAEIMGARQILRMMTGPNGRYILEAALAAEILAPYPGVEWMPEKGEVVY